MNSLSALLLLAGSCLQQFPAEFYQDFRGARFTPACFKKITQGDSEDIKPEPEGLRITVPVNEWHDPRAGIDPTFRVVGNFEITASFELLQTGDQPKGGAAGAVLQILKDSPASYPKQAGVSRVVHPKKGNVFVAWLSPASEGAQPVRRFFPSDVKTGQLRLVRTGSHVSWQIAVGPTGHFEEILHEEFGPQAVKIRLFADPGKGPTGAGAVDLRFLDLRIRADALPGALNIVAPPGSAFIWWLAVGYGGILLLFGTDLAFQRFCRSAPAETACGLDNVRIGNRTPGRSQRGEVASTSSSPSRQRHVSTWSKMLLSLTVIVFISVCTLLGIVVTPLVTPLGVFLIGRAILQYLFANLNNRRMLRVTGGAMVDGIFCMLPDLTDADKAYFRNLVGKKRTIDEFIAEIEAHPRAQIDGFREQLVSATIEDLRNKGFKVDRRIDANVPVYRVGIDELIDTLQSLKDQLFPFQRIWIVLNDPDNDALRTVIRGWIEAQAAEVLASFETGRMKLAQRDFLLGRWRFVDLKRADKRSAMAAAWLSTFGVQENEVEGFLQDMFDNPEKPLALKAETADISLNVDSDTVAHPFASFVTYLSFVLFGLSGLTSNVRIKNISERPDSKKPRSEAFWSWILSWLTFFRYDYANNVERAAQSWFWCVACMSGPWMGLLTSTVPDWLGRFTNYTLRGVRIKPGDDRKVTYELNRRQLRVAYNPWVVTWTDAPDNWPRYRIQQDRWTMSMYANFFTSVSEGQIWQLHIWTLMDQMYAAGFTFLVMFACGRLVVQSIITGSNVGLAAVGQLLLPYIVILVCINLLRGIYSVWDNRDWRGMLSSVYILVVVKELIPIKINRLFIKGVAPREYHWGGR